jgi:hypothetical protein
MDMWLGKGVDIGHAQIHTSQIELDPAFRMGQDKIKPRTANGTPFKVQIPQHKHWLSTRPMTLQSGGMIWHTDGCRLAGRSGAGVCGVRMGAKLPFSLGVPATMFYAEIFEILSCARDCIEMNYI